MKCLKSMKTNKNTIVIEDVVRGIPEFVIHEEAHKLREIMAQHIKRHIIANKVSFSDQHEAFEIMNESLDELEVNVAQCLERTLWQFLQHT